MLTRVSEVQPIKSRFGSPSKKKKSIWSDFHPAANLPSSSCVPHHPALSSSPPPSIGRHTKSRPSPTPATSFYPASALSFCQPISSLPPATPWSATSACCLRPCPASALPDFFTSFYYYEKFTFLTGCIVRPIYALHMGDRRFKLVH